MNKIFIVKGIMEGQSFELKNGTTLIGRAPDNDIQIDDPSVSRRHLRIIRRHEKYFMEDLKSRNGTWLHGRPIEPGEEVEVEEGAFFAIGNVIFSLGRRHSSDAMVTQYAIRLAGEEGKRKRKLLYKDSRITDRRKLELIYELSLLLMQSPDIKEICEKMMNTLFLCFRNIDSGCILLMNEHTRETETIVNRSRKGKQDDLPNYSRTIVNRVIREGSAVIMSDTSLEPQENLSESIEMKRIKSIMCVPLISESKVLGVIYVHSVKTPHGFVKADLFFLTALSSPAALALENALLYEKSRRTEEALRESEQKYRLLFDNAIDAICIVQDGVIKFSNPSTFVLTGFSREELSRIPFGRLFHPEDRDIVLERQNALLEGESVPSTYMCRAMNKDGEVLWLHTNVVPISWEGEPATLHFIRDITRQKRLENQILQSQKMEAIGTLAGGISHNFNNLLMGIQGNASLMLLGIEDSHPHYRKLKNIEKYIESAAELTGQLSGFAQGGNYRVRSTDINLLISKTCDHFESQSHGIHISTEFQEGIWPIKADPEQIELVFMKMYAHALHMMPGGGELMIRTINSPLEEKRAEALGLGRGKYVKVSITDTGIGMDTKTQRRLFEPFFTSREMGNDKGLGLAAVYGIIHHHKGGIQVESEKGKGSTFHFYLPAVDEMHLSKDHIKQNPVAGKGTILLVDDDEMIREVGEEYLEILGYNVILARDGNEAIALYNENKKNIDMVILDLVMPDMSGDAVYENLKSINCDVKVLLASGCSIDGKTTEMLQRGCRGYIHKPYDMAILSQKISLLLNDHIQNTPNC